MIFLPNNGIELFIMHPFYRYFAVIAVYIFFLLFSCVAFAQPADEKNNAPTISLSAPKHIKTLLTDYFELPQTPLADETDQSAFMRRAKHEINALLATAGYFTPTVTVTLQSQDNKLVINVDPGPPALVNNVTIEFKGDLAIDEPKQRARVKQLRDSWPLTIKTPFRSAEWEEAKAVLLSEVTRKDYPAAFVVESQAIVDPKNARVQLSIIIDSGPAFYFGDLVISGLERYDQTELNISNAASFRAGDPYSRDLLFAFQAALQNIPHLSTVTVRIDPDVLLHEAVPVEVLITEKPSKSTALGGGYSSNNGLRGEADFRDHNFLGRAWDMNTMLRWEQKRQTLLFGVDTLPDDNNANYNFDARLQTTNIENLKTTNQRVSLSRQHLTKRTLQQYGISWQRENKRPSGEANQINTALALNWRWRFNQIDDPVNIRDGHVTDLRVSGATQKILSDKNFLQTYARQQFWWPIGKHDVLYLRGEAGYTFAESSSGIPQEFLFRAGGIHSVRGYKFKSLGVREGNAVVGGRTMATGTLEYTHWFLQNWGAALFTDVGDAAENWKDFNFRLGYGAGVRWRSPAGPLAIDLARRHDTGTLRVYFSLAVAF